MAWDSGAFKERVYEIAGDIPPGKVITYGLLAGLAGSPAHARLAGRLMSGAPARLPAHRVVNRAGRTAPGWAAQRTLLEREGVIFKPNGNVDLKRCMWRPETR